VTVAVTDSRGLAGTGTLTTDIDVVPVPRPTFKFDDVLFDNNRSNLKPAAIKTLDEAIKVLRENPDVDLIIEGHTSSTATDAYNMALGERRAKTVFDYFIKNKIDKSRLSTVSFGESRPKDPGTTEAAHTTNRRVTLVVK
jgi:outer membrane protein OmpA-like peptidoglycan-associated protein